MQNDAMTAMALNNFQIYNPPYEFCFQLFYCCRILAQTKSSAHFLPANLILVDSENDGHVTDPTSPWCLVLGIVCFQLVESWMWFRGQGWFKRYRPSC